MVPGFGIIVNILKDNLEMHYFKLSLLKPTRETYDEFFPRNFNLPLFVIVLFFS